MKMAADARLSAIGYYYSCKYLRRKAPAEAPPHARGAKALVGSPPHAGGDNALVGSPPHAGGDNALVGSPPACGFKGGG